MKKSLVITDVTRMQEGRVCVAGYDNDGNCIRPVLPPPGIHETTLYVQKRPIVFPFAVVEYALTQPTPQPPHTEDYRYDSSSMRFVELLEPERRQAALEKSLFTSVSAIFEEPIHHDVGHYVMDGRGPRSLGTIRPQRIISAVYEKAPDGKDRMNIDPLFQVVPDIEERHVRMCGNETAESHLRAGFEQARKPASFKAEVW